MDIIPEPNRSIVVIIAGMPYKFVGKVKINKFAQSTGQEFEISGSGELFNLIDGNKFGDIEQFSFKVPRIQ